MMVMTVRRPIPGAPFLMAALAFALGASLGLREPVASRPACSCVTPAPPRASLQSSAAVFDGTVSRIERDPTAGPFAEVRVTFVVHTQWKGVTASPVRLVTQGDSAMCGYAFRLGQRYLVYADRLPAELSVGLCSRTRPYDVAEATELGPNEPPADAIPYLLWSALPSDPPCPRCAAPLPPPEARDDSDAAFHGKVAAVEDLGPERGHDRLVVYRNLGWWKGASEPFVTVRLPYSLWFCDRGLWMETGAAGDLPRWDEHLVFARRGADGILELGVCGQTRTFRDADAATLGPAQFPPTPAPSATPTAGGETTATAAATGTADPASTPTPTGSASSTATPMACPTLECPGCAGPRPAREWLAEADAVFLGRVTAVRPVGCDHLVSFRVLERFKGAPAATVDVFVGILSWQCMRRYDAGMEEVVFARAGSDGQLAIPMCFGITEGDVLGELRGGGTPVPTGRAWLPRLQSP